MTSKALRQVCVGLQDNAGAGVNVDTALRATCTLRPEVLKNHPEENIGSHAPARHYVAQIKPEGNLNLDATYEQIIVPISMALGDVTVSGSDPYYWVWNLPDATSPTFDLWTLEYTDGGTYVVRAIDVFATGLTISAEAPDSWQVEAPLTGGELTLPDALSATPALDDTVTTIKMAETSLYIDPDYATIGTSGVSEFISFNWKLENLLHEKQFAGSLYPNGRGSDIWKTTLELILEVSAEAAQSLADMSLLTTQIAVRIRGRVDANDYCDIDGMYMVGSVDTLDDRDGNNRLKLTLLGEKDASDNTGQVVVVNDVDAL